MPWGKIGVGDQEFINEVRQLSESGKSGIRELIVNNLLADGFPLHLANGERDILQYVKRTFDLTPKDLREVELWLTAAPKGYGYFGDAQAQNVWAQVKSWDTKGYDQGVYKELQKAANLRPGKTYADNGVGAPDIRKAAAVKWPKNDSAGASALDMSFAKAYIKAATDFRGKFTPYGFRMAMRMVAEIAGRDRVRP